MNRAVAFPIVRRPDPNSEATVDTGTLAVWFWCPGCEQAHAVYVGGDHPGPKWAWNGSCELPTFSPSILVRGNKGDTVNPFVCHSFVNDGRIQFLGDCTHALAGQTVELGEPPEWLRK